MVELNADHSTTPVQTKELNPEITEWCDGACNEVLCGLLSLPELLKSTVSKATHGWLVTEVGRIAAKMAEILHERGKK